MAKEFSQADFEKAVDAVYQRIQLKKGTIRMKLQPQTPSGSLFDVVGQE